VSQTLTVSSRRLSPTVEVSDVNEASRLLREAIKDYATDPKTGRIDMDLILSGTGSHDRHVKDDRVRELKTLLLGYENSSVAWNKLLNDFNEQSDVVSTCRLAGLKKSRK
jgi:DNA replication licensing factor MCM4